MFFFNLNMPKLTHETASAKAIAKNIRLLSTYHTYDDDMNVRCEICFRCYRASLRNIIVDGCIECDNVCRTKKCWYK